MKTSTTVTIMRTTSAVAATESWMRCTRSARLTSRSRALIALDRVPGTGLRRTTPLLYVFLVELASRLASLVDGSDRLLDPRSHASLDLGDVGIGERVDLDALLDHLVAALPL